MAYVAIADSEIDPESPFTTGLATKFRDNVQPWKVIDIGNWDMDASSLTTVAHGLIAANIRSMTGVIRNDENTLFHIIGGQVVTTGILEVGFSKQSAPFQAYDSTLIYLTRETGGVFDSGSYNASPFNRGFLTVRYDIP